MLGEEGKQPATSRAMGGPTSEVKVEEGSKERYGPRTRRYREENTEGTGIEYRKYS